MVVDDRVRNISFVLLFMVIDDRVRNIGSGWGMDLGPVIEAKVAITCLRLHLVYLTTASRVFQLPHLHASNSNKNKKITRGEHFVVSGIRQYFLAQWM